MCELTIENGKSLGCRRPVTAKRTAQAALKVAVDLVDEGVQRRAGGYEG